MREIHRANADTLMAVPSLSLRQAAETSHWRGPPTDPRGGGPAYGYGQYRSPWETARDGVWDGWISDPLPCGRNEFILGVHIDEPEARGGD